MKMASLPGARGNKFHAVRTTLDGITFDSKAEATRYAELRMLERAKVITDLKLQPKFPLVVQGVLVATYIADFSYFEAGSTELVVEDVKSPATKTAVYALKAKLLLALHGIAVKEVQRS